MSRNKFFALILFATFCLSSCTDNMERNVVEMLGKDVHLDLNNYHVVKGRKNYYPSNIKYRLIIYLDSLECLSCATSRLHQWNDMILANLNRKVGFEFIYSPRVKEWGLIRNSIASSRFIRDVYIDTAGIFKKHHPWIPDALECHTFLVDSNSKVVMVGDPRRNKRLMNLFKDIVNGSLLC